MAALDPAPHFGTTCEDEGNVARIIIRGAAPEIVAVLDGLAIYDADDLIGLLQIAISAASSEIHSEVNDKDGFNESLDFTATVSTLGSRLPLAAMALRWLLECRDDPDLPASTEGEGYDAEVAEILHGPISGFDLSGELRDGVVRHARASLKTAEGEYRDQLETILGDTGTEEGTGKPCTLSSLPMPRLVEWSRRWSREALCEYEQVQHGKGTAAKWGEQDESGQHLKLMRNGLWTALRAAIGEGDG